MQLFFVSINYFAALVRHLLILSSQPVHRPNLIRGSRLPSRDRRRLSIHRRGSVHHRRNHSADSCFHPLCRGPPLCLDQVRRYAVIPVVLCIRYCTQWRSRLHARIELHYLLPQLEPLSAIHGLSSPDGYGYLGKHSCPRWHGFAFL